MRSAYVHEWHFLNQKDGNDFLLYLFQWLLFDVISKRLLPRATKANLFSSTYMDMLMKELDYLST